MKFVLLTQRNGQKVSVNFDKVSYFMQSAAGGTLIVYQDGSQEGVNEVYTVVANAVNFAAVS